MEYVVLHVVLALLFAIILAPHADRLREMWRDSLLSSELTVFIAPYPDRRRGRRRRVPIRGKPSAKTSGKAASRPKSRGQ
jgi:hypothetical protein